MDAMVTAEQEAPRPSAYTTEGGWNDDAYAIPAGFEDVAKAAAERMDAMVSAEQETPRPSAYGPLNYRTAARTLFLRLYLARFCSFFRHFFAVFSVLTPGIRSVAPEDRGPLPKRSKTAEERVVAADLFLMDRYTAEGGWSDDAYAIPAGFEDVAKAAAVLLVRERHEEWAVPIHQE